MMLTDRNMDNRKRLLSIGLRLAIVMNAAGGFLSTSRAEESIGVQVPPEFTVELYADDDLAHDIYSMTIDSFGRVVVSGAGYVKILIDTNDDGVADDTRTFVNGPRTGAQGMYFAGQDLLCAGDGGLLRYKDRNADDQADGPPDLFWKIDTGGEHDLHAIRKGPDGWWYAIAGNNAGVNENHVTLETSPVKNPQSGTILRFKPDLTGAEVYAHGFRNAYDFDFAGAGDIFSFDSDGERDVSLPWYRPTRVFHVLPGSHQGWFSRSWKRPDHFFDMPPVVGAFGRGSPTGVETYAHTQFPRAYHEAVFVLDWTYGRVIALQLQPNGSTWKSEPIEFMTAIGQHGFAPTDIAVGRDGSLFVSVGGRGTRGGVYRIRARNTGPQPALYGTTPLVSREQKVEACLTAPQPLSSWSRRVWEPIVADLTSEPFISAAMDRQLPTQQRIRAIEILVEKFSGLDGDMLFTLAADPDPLIRARCAWAIGRTETQEPDPRNLTPFLNDPHPVVARKALEALQGATAEHVREFVASLGKQIGQPDPFVRQSALHVLQRLDAKSLRDVAAIGFPAGWHASIPVAAAFIRQSEEVQPYSIDISLRILQSNRDAALKLEAVRILQLALGDVGPGTGLDPVFDGYRTRTDLKDMPEVRQRIVTTLADVYPTQDSLLDHELERTVAMVTAEQADLFGVIVNRLTADSHPVDDIHRLIVLAAMPVSRTDQQRQAIAQAIVNLDGKIADRNLNQDSNWSDRVLELYAAHVEQDSQLPLAILESPEFGQPGHVQFISQFPPEEFDNAIAAFSGKIRENPDYAWNSDVIMLLSESESEQDQQLIRSKFEDFALRNAVVLALATNPRTEDRKYFSRALEFASLETMQEITAAFGLLPPSAEAEENVALVAALRRLGHEDEERLVRDQIVELLRRNLGEQFGYRFGADGQPQRQVVESWINAISKRFPDEFAKLATTNTEDLAGLKSRLAKVDWSQGNLDRGAELFAARACVQCHGGRRALGPDLSGAAGRFSRDDLFTAIVFPNRDVSPRYQTTQIATQSGQVRNGLIVYESVDGVVLRDANNRTWRIEAEEIEFRRTLNQSLMPSGLLKDLSDQDLADLYAYLHSLGQRQTANTGE